MKLKKSKNATIKKLIRQEQERMIVELGNGGPLKSARWKVAQNIWHWRRMLGIEKTRSILNGAKR